MLRLIKILLLVGFVIFMVSCHNKITCPAYQSKFILDEDEFKNQFSLFEIDSTPKQKLGKVKKSKYGIIVQKQYKKKFNEMKTIAMETVYPETSDSLLIAWVIPDSLRTDSLGGGRVYHSPYLTLFNNDQALYDAMYGHLLQAPRSSKQEIQEEVVKNSLETAEKIIKEKIGDLTITVVNVGLVETEPIDGIIAGINGMGGVVLDPSAATIDPVAGVEKAAQLGYQALAALAACRLAAGFG